MQIAPFRIWTLVDELISYDGNRYTVSASIEDINYVNGKICSVRNGTVTL